MNENIISPLRPESVHDTTLQIRRVVRALSPVRVFNFKKMNKEKLLFAVCGILIAALLFIACWYIMYPLKHSQ